LLQHFRITVLLITALTGAIAPSWASACTPASDQNQFSKAYYRTVTSVYRARARDFTPVNPQYPEDNFTVVLQPTDLIWGERPTEPVRLRSIAGACVEWYLWDGDDTPLNGQSYLVFAAPAAREDPSELRILPAAGRSNAEALVMFGRLQETGSGAPPPPPPPDAIPMPLWPPKGAVDEAKLGGMSLSAATAWLWLPGGILLLLIGIGIGRISRPRRKGASSS
jgi:hypothetical protein